MENAPMSSLRDSLRNIVAYIKDLFSLHLDTDEAGTIDSIHKSIDFKGGNLWGLVFACLIASIGLNNNSTAVIIGAMLISPLMGPIVGAGYAIGTNDFETLKNAMRNLGIFIVVSLLTSILYFLISPLKEPTEELLARTRPNIYDVLIAIFGGAIGIVASSRKDRGNAIPGVAIATALMPPLCTVGYGIASGHWRFSLGAFYLFFINTVFIALTTTIFVRSLHFPVKEFLDAKQRKRSQIAIWTVVVLLVLPSIYTTYQVVNEVIFATRAKKFVSENFESQLFTQLHPNTTLVKYNMIYDTDVPIISISLMGDSLPSNEVLVLENYLSKYGLYNTRLQISQSGDFRRLLGDLKNMSGTASGVTITTKDNPEQEDILRTMQKRIQVLEAELQAHYRERSEHVAKVLSVTFPDVQEFSYQSTIRTIPIKTDSLSNVIQIRRDTVPTVLIKWDKEEMNYANRQRLLRLLEIELGVKGLELIVY